MSIQAISLLVLINTDFQSEMTFVIKPPWCEPVVRNPLFESYLSENMCRITKQAGMQRSMIQNYTL